ncbi:MAG: regulatory protein RecX, partial [Atopobiaceae bacterium]|nr:regulatory protein RecX [Atopobiaceae bacterium]
AIINRAESAHLIDDARFADIFIRSKVLSGWGSARIVRELKLKGIEASSVPGWPYEYLSEDEYDRALEIARTRRDSLRRSYEKLARYLSSRGFSASVCSRVASRVVSETNEEAELT